MDMVTYCTIPTQPSHWLCPWINALQSPTYRFTYTLTILRRVGHRKLGSVNPQWTETLKRGSGYNESLLFGFRKAFKQILRNRPTSLKKPKSLILLQSNDSHLHARDNWQQLMMKQTLSLAAQRLDGPYSWNNSKLLLILNQSRMAFLKSEINGRYRDSSYCIRILLLGNNTSSSTRWMEWLSCREFKLACSEVEHGDKVGAVAVSSDHLIGPLKDTDAIELTFDHLQLRPIPNPINSWNIPSGVIAPPYLPPVPLKTWKTIVPITHPGLIHLKLG